MKEETNTLIRYRLERAQEALEEAELLLGRGYGNTYVNRLYYACFYAVSALLLSRGLSSAKHTGVRSLFHKEFVKPGAVAQEKGQLYDKLFDNRQKGDYTDLTRFDIEEVAPWYDEAKAFVRDTTAILRAEVPDL